MENHYHNDEEMDTTNKEDSDKDSAKGSPRGERSKHNNDDETDPETFLRLWGVIYKKHEIRISRFALHGQDFMFFQNICKIRQK